MTGSVPPQGDLDSASAAPLHPAAREALLAALDRGYGDPRRLRPAQLITRRIGLDEAPEALAAMSDASPTGVTMIRP